MAMMISPELAELFMILTGEQWPDIDEDKLVLLGDHWDNAADRIENELAPALDAALNKILSNVRGESELQMAQSLEAFTRREPYYFDSGTKQYRTLAKFGRDTATMVNYVKLMVIASLV